MLRPYSDSKFLQLLAAVFWNSCCILVYLKPWWKLWTITGLKLRESYCELITEVWKIDMKWNQTSTIKIIGLLLVGTQLTLVEVETWDKEYVFCWSVLTSQNLGCLWPWKGARQPRGSRLLMLQADRSDGLLHNLHTCKTIHSILKTTHYFSKIKSYATAMT